MEDIYALEEFDISVDDNRIEGQILEGQYVFYDGKTIQEAENHPLAILYREINRLVINELIQRNQESYPETYKNTEVWLNLNYRHYSTTSDDMLIQLNNIGVKIIDPIVKNSTKQIKILYPDISFDMVRNKPPRGKINNASVLYQLCLGGRSMLFPGDIETEGWDNVPSCKPYLYNTDYYCISHHGSKTGHLRNGCPSGAKKGIQTLADCLNRKTKHQILMGKNGAYPGIYANEVLNDFGSICKTEEMDNYIKLRWDSGIIEAH